jgi:hypothetical protein
MPSRNGAPPSNIKPTRRSSEHKLTTRKPTPSGELPQRLDELIDEQATLDALLTELHRRKAKLGTEWATTIDFTKAQAWARAVATAINH